MRILGWISVALIWASGLFAEEVVLGLSHDSIQITTDFHGSEILIFGAVKRTEPIPETEPLHVVVAIAGPSEPVMVRRKDRRLGIWVNTAGVEVDAAPSFYAISTTGPWTDVISDTEDLRHNISIPRAIRSVGAPMDIEDPTAFTEALIRIREKNGLYSLNEGAVELAEDTLFRTSVRLPSNLTEGNYRTRIFLTRNREVVATYEADIAVEKVGLERWLFNLSRQQPFVYGLMSLAIAIAAGWGASTVFRLIRSN